MVALGYYLNFSAMKENFNYKLVSNALKHQLSEDPDNIPVLRNLAIVYHETGKYDDALVTYERLLNIDGEQAIALNNLAWLLVTVPDSGLRDPKRALMLAKKAVAMEKNPVFLDTLAEVYYANGFIYEAVETIEEAILLEEGDKKYYEDQLEKFKASLPQFSFLR
jgi:tetratricopeptide (TPR) repeat protein